MYTVVIIGGGASGFFCAAQLVNLPFRLRIIILEKNSQVLQKVKVSGGGRCNVTHACFMNSQLVKSYPRGKNFLKKTMQIFSPKNTMEWFEQQGVELKTESDGRIFPVSNQSQTIIQCLLQKLSNNQTEVLVKQEVTEIIPKSPGFDIVTKSGKNYLADAVMLACGGFQKTEQYDFIRALDHSIIPPIPSLFTFNANKHPIQELMGISVNPVTVKIVGTTYTETGPILITHWGLSGPVILKLSAFAARDLNTAQYQFEILINWLNEAEQHVRDRWQSIRDQQGAQIMSHKNPFGLPDRLWQFLLMEAEVSGQRKWSELTGKEQNKLIHHLTTYPLKLAGKTTFKEEFVTCGGVSLAEVDANTMESKIQPGLFFGGEVLDVDGITGGFNFQHAWTSGYIAARGIVSFLNKL